MKQGRLPTLAEAILISQREDAERKVEELEKELKERSKKKMENEKGYNGYSNYETWCVNLWLDNDEGLYREFQDRIRKGISVYDLSKMIQELVEEGNPITTTSFYSDLMNSAIKNVEFYEIAENMLEDYKNEN